MAVKSNINTTSIDWSETVYASRDEVDETISNYTSGATYAVNDTESLEDAQKFDAITDSMTGIFGMPYQFSNIVDRNIVVNGKTYQIGRKYNQKIFSVMPILFLTPGEPTFMEGFSASSRSDWANKLVKAIGGRNDNIDWGDEGKDQDDGRFYSFKSNFTEYRNYANTSLRTLARLMGIQNISVPVPGSDGDLVKLGNMDVKQFMNTSFTNLFGADYVVPFYLDAENSISENYGNGTTESSLAGTVNGYASSAREIQFLMGSGTDKGLSKLLGNAVENVGTAVAESLGDIADVLASNSVISRVTNELTTVVTGGKIVFPKIWDDSNYSKSYSINIKLRSPDPDPVSIFLNIYMPIILLISMTAPRQIGNSSNSYQSPFLVRATYKSVFSCDLGIISSLSIDRGGENMWNMLGQPITADVTLTIEDLYEYMMISKRYGMVSNTAQMDYLATLAGVDLNEYEPDRIVKYVADVIRNTPRDWARNAWAGVQNTLNNFANKGLGLFSDVRYQG